MGASPQPCRALRAKGRSGSGRRRSATQESKKEKTHLYRELLSWGTPGRRAWHPCRRALIFRTRTPTRLGSCAPCRAVPRWQRARASAHAYADPHARGLRTLTPVERWWIARPPRCWTQMTTRKWKTTSVTWASSRASSCKRTTRPGSSTRRRAHATPRCNRRVAHATSDVPSLPCAA